MLWKQPSNNVEGWKWKVRESSRYSDTPEVRIVVGDDEWSEPGTFKSKVETTNGSVGTVPVLCRKNSAYYVLRTLFDGFVVSAMKSRNKVGRQGWEWFNAIDRTFSLLDLANY